MATFQAWSCSIDQALFSPPGSMHTCIPTCVHVDTLYVNLYRVCMYMCIYPHKACYYMNICIISCIGVALYPGSQLIAQWIRRSLVYTSTLYIARSSPVFHLKWCNGHLLCCRSKSLGVVIMKPSKRVADKQRLPNDCCTSNQQKYESQEATFYCCPQEMSMIGFMAAVWCLQREPHHFNRLL